MSNHDTPTPTTITANLSEREDKGLAVYELSNGTTLHRFSNAWGLKWWVNADMSDKEFNDWFAQIETEIQALADRLPAEIEKPNIRILYENTYKIQQMYCLERHKQAK